MTVKEFKKSEIYKKANKVRYFDVDGVDVSGTPLVILNMLNIIGTSHNSDGSIDIDVQYIS